MSEPESPFIPKIPYPYYLFRAVRCNTSWGNRRLQAGTMREVRLVVAADTALQAAAAQHLIVVSNHMIEGAVLRLYPINRYPIPPTWRPLSPRPSNP